MTSSQKIIAYIAISAGGHLARPDGDFSGRAFGDGVVHLNYAVENEHF